jgi:hypothetical protein
MNRIESITRGAGQSRIHFTTNDKFKASPCYVEEIICVEAVIGKGIHNDITINTYKGWVDGKLRFETEAGGGLLITYEK